MTSAAFKELTLGLPGVIEHPHFDRIAFKVEKKTIFASIHEASCSVNIKLTMELQSEFSQLDSFSIFPVPNKFGLQGWTTFEISRLDREVVFAALEAAYQQVLKK